MPFILFGLVYGVQHHFQQYLSYIVVVSFIGGGNKRTRRKPIYIVIPLQILYKMF